MKPSRRVGQEKLSLKSILGLSSRKIWRGDLPPSYKQELYHKITTHCQENLKVEEYICEFEQLQMRIELNEDNELTIARFIKRLSPSIAYKVEL